MDIRKQYEILSNKDYKFSLINEINILKDLCIRENNHEFLYKCNLLISDVYIEHDNIEEALTLLLKDIKSIDQSVFRNIYLDYLDRLIYLYINKRNYNIALKYVTEKGKLINKNDLDSLNRLYMEYSYIYGEVGQFDKSEYYFKEILENNPSDDVRSHVLSNLTKIYIDKNDVYSAKEALNECLCFNTDHEGEVYCDYLLAKISVLEGKTKEALQLYESIFINEDINNMTLSIMNDYLKLLNSLKMYDKALLLMNKLSLFINASDDLFVIKSFYHNKLEYFVGTNDNSNISATMKDIAYIEKQISDNELTILNANLEEEKNDIVEKTESNVFNKIDILTSLVDIALKGNSLREIIMDFSNKLQKIIPFDTLTFVLFNKVDEQEFQMSDKIDCLRYKNKRLYEKNVNYELLRNTIVEMMVTKNRPIAIDFTTSKIDINDIFTNKQYDEDVKYLNSVPCLYNDDTFASVIYSSKDIDLTDHSNTVLLKVATKLLESALVILFTKENASRIEETCNMIVKENKIGLFYYNNDTFYLSEFLKNMLQVRYNSINANEFIKKISKSDTDVFIKAISSNEKNIIKFKYTLFDKVCNLLMVIEPCFDTNGKLIYRQGTIKSLEEKTLGYALSEKDLKNKIFELKKKTNIIEFKFSLVKIKGSIDEYINVKNTFGVEPYYLNDSSFVVILENEANLRTIEKMIKNFSSRCAVIRYPRDIINVDEFLSIADIMIQYNKTYFDNDVYRGFLKKINIVNRIDNILSKDLSLRSFEFTTINGNSLYEIKPIITGLDERERIKKYLGNELISRYDKKMIDTIIHSRLDSCNYFFDLSNDFIYKILNEYNTDKFSNITFVMYEYNKLTPSIFEKLKKSNIRIIIDVKLIDILDAFYFTTGVIEGVFVSENIDKNDINKVIRLANMFNLSLICYNNVYEYDKVYYYAGNTKTID